MNKRRSGGFTLIEMLVAIVIIILLVIGIGVGSRAALSAYKVSVFESECSTLSDILNTAIGDVLRYCTVENAASIAEEGSTAYTFSSVDYAVSKATLAVEPFDGDRSMVYINGRTFGDNGGIDDLLVNAGSYPNLTVTALSTKFFPSVYVSGKAAAGYFLVEYTIASTKDSTLTNSYSFFVRQVNADISQNLANDSYSSEGLVVNDDPTGGETNVNTCLITYDQNLAGKGVLRYLNTNSYRTAIIKSVPKGSTAQIAAIEYSSSNYELVGWSDVPGATEAKYVAGNEIVVDRDITLYAVWQGAKMNLTLHCINAQGETTCQYTYRCGDTVGSIGLPSGFSFPVTLRFKVKPSDELVANKVANRPLNGWGFEPPEKLWSTGPVLDPKYQLTESDIGRDLYAYWGGVYIDVKNPTYVKSNWHNTWAFEGTWYKIDKGNNSKVSGRTLTGSTEVYAYLSRTVTYKDGDTTLETKTFYSYESVPALKEVTVGEGYIGAWYSGTTKVTDLSSAPFDANGSLTLSLKRDPLYKYSITFAKGDGGDTVHPATVPGVINTGWLNNSTYTGTFTATRPGYTHTGWTASVSGVTTNGKSVSIPGSGAGTVSVTLTATWAANTYSVTYDPNGGSGSIANTPGTVGSDITLSNGNGFTGSTYKVTFNANGGSCSTSSVTKTDTFSGWATSAGGSKAYNGGQSVRDLALTNGATFKLYAVWAHQTINLPTPAQRTGYEFLGWSDGKTTYQAGASYSVSSTKTLTAQWKLLSYNIKASSLSNASFTVTFGGSTYKISDTKTSVPVPYNTSVTVTVNYSKNKSKSCTIKSGNTTYTSGKAFNMPASDVTLTASSSCIVPGTLIALADGTTKPVEELTGNETILSWDFYTGKMIETNISVLNSHGETEYIVTNLKFSNGSVLGVVGGHDLFDLDLNEFVCIDEENYSSYIGHSFSCITSDGSLSTTTLVSADVVTKVTNVYSVWAAGGMDCFGNGMMNIGPKASYLGVGMFSIKDMKYDEAEIKASVDKYGLYTPDEWSEYLTTDEFYAFNTQYFRILVGKGLITEEKMIYFIQNFVK